MRKRIILSSKNSLEPIEGNYSDICFYDKENDSKIIVPLESFSATEYPLSQYIPIGIVAVPSEHTDEQRPRILSLAEMSYNTPDSGIVTSPQGIYWGGYGHTVTDLPIKKQYPYLSNLSVDGIVNYTSYCYLPSDYFSGRTDNPLNSLEGFYYNYSTKMCSPYKEDGSKEPRYFDESNTGNVLADFDGKSNTEKILAVDNSNSTTWQTASTIDNSDADNQYVHPAAQCTWRYHTDGTKQGDWYLPSEGELGYALARQGSINLVINTLNTQYSTTLGIQFGVANYWSSTQNSYRYALGMYFRNGQVNEFLKNYKNCVRAFLMV